MNSFIGASIITKYTHLTPICSSLERKSGLVYSTLLWTNSEFVEGLDRYIMSKSVANLSYRSIYATILSMKTKSYIMKKLSLAYFGTPYFSARFLEKLLTDISIKHLIEIKLVVTQPDQPVGRKHILTKSPVKVVAEKFNIPVLDSLRSLERYYASSKAKRSTAPGKVEKNLKDVDLALIYYYGKIIPKGMLTIPKIGFWNIHFSLLPKLRGATPATFSLILGDKKTAVSLVQTDEKLDHGDLIAQREVKINPNEKRIELEERLHDISYKIFVEQINNLSNNKIKLTPQDHSQATYTRFPVKDDGFIPLSTLKKALKNQPLNFEELPRIIQEYSLKYKLPILQRPSSIGNSSRIIYNLFRGLYPWPGLWTIVDIKGQKKRLKITDLTINNPSTSLRTSPQLTIKRVQLEGKKEVDFDTFNQVYRVF